MPSATASTLPSTRPVLSEPGREWECYTSRQAHERASTNVDRLQRRVRELSERLNRMGDSWDTGRPAEHVFQSCRWACGGLPGGSTRSGAPMGTSGAWPGPGVVGAVPLRPSPRGAPGVGGLGSSNRRVPDDRVPVGVVPAAARPKRWLGLPCPAVGAEWEQRSAASCGQMRSYTVIVAASIASDVRQRRQPAALFA